MQGNRRYKVAIAGYYGFGNLGDELLALASVKALQRAGVTLKEIVILSADPKRSAIDLGVDAVDRWSFKSVTKALINSRSLLLGGGGLFQDVTSVSSCMWYWGLIRLAKLCGSVPWALGQSIGPLQGIFSSWFTKDALRACKVLQVRDSISKSLCENINIHAFSGSDLVLSLTEQFKSSMQKYKKKDTGYLLLNLRPCGDLKRFIEAAKAFTDSFLGEIVGAAMSGEDEELLNCLLKEGHIKISRVERLSSLDDAAQIFSNASCAIGMRLHFAILAAMSGTPLSALSYDPKVEAFALSVGLAPWLGGLLPEPRVPVLSNVIDIIDEIDTLCKKGLIF